MKLTCEADVVGMGVLRPGPVPVIRAAPARLARADWPAYRLTAETEATLFPPDRIKRMGRGQAMAMGAARRAIEGSAAPPAPGSETAVALGSAWAEEGDEIAFLENIIALGEKGARPAYFVNSVKNALASQLALAFGWRGENQTFHHDALSFETALWYGARLVSAERVDRVVVCGVDALVEFAEMQGHLLGQLRTDPAPLAPLEEEGRADGCGSIPGEGAAAFILAAPGSVADPLARLVGVSARAPVIRPPRLDAAEEIAFIERTVADLGAVELVLMGANGDPSLDRVYAAVAAGLSSRAPRAAIGVYRHFTGDFATASALGLALAVNSVREPALPEQIRLVRGRADQPQRVLLYHLTSAGKRSTMLVSAGARS